MRYFIFLCVTIYLSLAKPLFDKADIEDADFDGFIDAWITKTDVNGENIKILQHQIEEIGDVLESQSEIIGKLQDLVSFGRRDIEEGRLLASPEPTEGMEEVEEKGAAKPGDNTDDTGHESHGNNEETVKNEDDHPRTEYPEENDNEEFTRIGEK